MPSLTQGVVGLGVILFIASLLLKRARLRKAALIGSAISFVVAVALNPDVIYLFADKVSLILDGELPDY